MVATSPTTVSWQPKPKADFVDSAFFGAIPPAHVPAKRLNGMPSGLLSSLNGSVQTGIPDRNNCHDLIELDAIASSFGRLSRAESQFRPPADKIGPELDAELNAMPWLLGPPFRFLG